jgi:pimeloyl-ACP methyl ester carboxylesterase
VLLASPLAGLAQDRSSSNTAYTIFVNGTSIGREDVTVRTDSSGTTIITRGQSAEPLNAILRQVEFRYGPSGAPQSFVFVGALNGDDVELRTEFRDGSAVIQTTSQGQTVSDTHVVSPGSVVLPSGVFGGFVALAQRLATASTGDAFRVVTLPFAELEARLTDVRTERMQTGTSIFDVRQYDIELRDAGGALAVGITTGTDGSLLRVTLPTQGLDVLRTDLASVRTRTDVYSNPGDEAVVIPAPGFNIGATLTIPRRDDAPLPGGGDTQLPAVVLVTGLSAPDRDTLVPGISVMAQLAGALSDAGFMVLRYDRRGSGQSGGRSESATLSDYANDARTVVRWVSSRDDVDRRRIAIVGHGEGAWMAMLTAEREGRIAALVTIAAAAAAGPDMILEQQQMQLDALRATDAERADRVRLQKEIHEAVRTGRGWDEIPPHLRREADTPWFQSLLAYDPAKVIGDVDVPVLVVHGDLDREVPVAHAERLASLARQGDAESVDLVIARGVNHLLLPAVTGDTREYATLPDRNVSRDLAQAVTAFLTRVLPAPPARR